MICVEVFRPDELDQSVNYYKSKTPRNRPTQQIDSDADTKASNPIYVKRNEYNRSFVSEVDNTHSELVTVHDIARPSSSNTNTNSF